MKCFRRHDFKEEENEAKNQRTRENETQNLIWPECKHTSGN